MPETACFVTPSYDRDFERCKLLVDSRRVCAPGMTHFIVVDPHDVPLFKQLADPATIILDSRELMDRTFRKLWGHNGWWVSSRTLPLRGWMSQQIRKLAMPRVTDADILVNLDSDVVFVRQFEPSILLRDGKLALFEVDYRNEEILAWATLAQSLTGAPLMKPVRNHVGMLIPWWRSHTEQLTRQIEAHMARPWQEAIGRLRSFSEYMAYGVYTRGFGIERACHFADNRKLVRTSWHEDTASEDGLAKLFDCGNDPAVAVMVHSKDSIDPSLYRRYAEAQWERLS